MANTYFQIYMHTIFAVKGRSSLISPKWKEDLYKYISGILSHRSQKLLAINGMPDHIHLLIGIKPNCNLSDLVRDVKAGSSKHINESRWTAGRFEWQEGFGAFSLGHSQLDTIFTYIRNQEEHHRKKTFKEEYTEFLEAYKIEYQPQFLFDEIPE
jgi:putative transposase